MSKTDNQNLERTFVTRRAFLGRTTFTALSLLLSGWYVRTPSIAEPISAASGMRNQQPLAEFSYSQIKLSPSELRDQFDQIIGNLIAMNNDDILKPYRVRSGLPAPGKGFGGWYDENPDYDFRSSTSPGFAPGHCFGQWLSALARAYATTDDGTIRDKLSQLIDGYKATISPKFYENFRFPAYTYDKILLGLIDAKREADLSEALPILEKTTEAALPSLPSRATDHGTPPPDQPAKDDSWTWDESYTMPENLFIAWEFGAGDQYKKLAERMLLDESFFDPLAENKNVLPDKHAYSHMNALCSAAKAYMAVGSEKHLRAAQNGFRMVQEQSYITGGWGPDESFRKPGSGDIGSSLTSTHHSFETCGAYAHMKLTRYLLRITQDTKYGDSMERIIYNTVLGVKPLLPDGSAFYYSDYNMRARKSYYWFKCPCCAGTLPQIVTDFGICSYFKDNDGILVNLYIPSTIEWEQKGTKVSLKQETTYPLDGKCRLDLTTSSDTDFALRLRIPGWAQGARVSVNGKLIASPAPGAFASVERTWKDGDHVELELPLPLRLEAVDAQHKDMVALIRGPLVLFALTEDTPVVTAKQLLSAKRRTSGGNEFIVNATSGPITFRPFSAIQDEQYSTYLKVSG
jgi:DUF1680 family protein